MKKRLSILLAIILSLALVASVEAGGTFSRVKTWATGETLTASDLNAEFDNIITNATPAGIDDASADATAMQATTDPYPAGVASLATSLLGEIQRIRYVLAQITGETYWYQDPDTTIAALNQGQNPPGTVLPYAGATAPAGYLLCYGQAVSQTTYAALYAIIGHTFGADPGGGNFILPDLRGRVPLGKDNMGGSSANRITDTEADTVGSAAGSESHLHATGDVTLTAAQSGLPAHSHTVTERVSSSQPNQDGIVVGVNAPGGGGPISTNAVSAAAASSAHNHGNTQTVDHTMPYLTLNYIIKF